MSSPALKLKPVRKPTAEDNLPLAKYVADKFLSHQDRRIPIEDTEQYADALVALVRAEQKFDPNINKLFASIAAKAMKNELIDGCRDQARHSIPTVEIDGLDLPAQEYSPPPKEGLLETLLAEHPEDTDIDRRNRQMLKDHFLNGRTQTNIAEEYGVTRMAVSLAIAQAIDKIRDRHATYIEDHND